MDGFTRSIRDGDAEASVGGVPRIAENASGRGSNNC